MMKNKPQILAPAGNMEMLISAVRCGADAVYLGARDFNARKGAENFDNDSLIKAIKYCRIRGIKSYLTLNTVVSDSELLLALGVAEIAIKAGVSGIIVADLGLAQSLKEAYPEVYLVGSTQMSVHSCSALPLLSRLGIKRVVLGREMSKAGIAEFCRAAEKYGIEAEAFVHGALCMSVSGQCLLSAVIGGRSGNRGLCAGTCRLPISGGGRNYALSLKDISLIDRAAALADLGVKSFKIEGRLKRPEYVAAAVTALKASLDGVATAEHIENLKNIFSRSGFTSGYFDNKTGDDMFGYRTKEDSQNTAATLPKLHELYRNERQCVPLKINAEILKDRPIKITVSDGVSTAYAMGDSPAAAKNAPATKQSIIKSLERLGGTPFYAEDIKVNLDEGLFVSAAELNNLRRQAVEQIEKKAKCSNRNHPSAAKRNSFS